MMAAMVETWSEMSDVTNPWNTTNSSGLMTSALPEQETEEEITSLFDHIVYQISFIYVAPIIIFGGSIGNLMSFAVLQSRHFRNAPSSFLLSVLALVDTGVLNTGLLRHFLIAATGELNVRNLSRAGCKFHYFFTYYLAQMSSWTLVLMTLERLASVIAPFKARELCSRRRIVIAWTVVALALFALNGHAFKALELFSYTYFDNTTNRTEIGYYCSYTDEMEFWALNIWPWIDLTMLTVVPFVIILAANVVIITQVIRARDFRRGDTRNGASGSGKDSTAQKQDDQMQSITAMLVTISVVFLLTTTPVSIYFAFVDDWPYETAKDVYNVHTAYTICNILYYVNCSINFLLYCVSGAKFRHALLSILGCGAKKDRTSSTGQTMYAMRTTKDAATRMTSVSVVEEQSKF